MNFSALLFDTVRRIFGLYFRSIRPLTDFFHIVRARHALKLFDMIMTKHQLSYIICGGHCAEMLRGGANRVRKDIDCLLLAEPESIESIISSTKEFFSFRVSPGRGAIRLFRFGVLIEVFLFHAVEDEYIESVSHIEFGRHFRFPKSHWKSAAGFIHGVRVPRLSGAICAMNASLTRHPSDREVFRDESKGYEFQESTRTQLTHRTGYRFIIN